METQTEIEGEKVGEMPPSSMGYFEGPLFKTILTRKVTKNENKVKLGDNSASDSKSVVENDSNTTIKCDSNGSTINVKLLTQKVSKNWDNN